MLNSSPDKQEDSTKLRQITGGSEVLDHSVVATAAERIPIVLCNVDFSVWHILFVNCAPSI